MPQDRTPAPFFLFIVQRTIYHAQAGAQDGNQTDALFDSLTLKVCQWTIALDFVRLQGLGRLDRHEAAYGADQPPKLLGRRRGWERER